MMPGAVVARPPGGCQGADGPDTACTHGRQPWAHAWTREASRPTPTYVLIDHAALGNPQAAGLRGAGLLPPLALGGGAALMARGLADIDVGLPWALARVHRGAHGYPPRSGHWGCRG
jgi:hypothetical protein